MIGVPSLHGTFVFFDLIGSRLCSILAFLSCQEMLPFKPIQGFKLAFGDDFYVCRFQDPEFEKEIAEINLEAFFKQVLTMCDPKPPIIPKGEIFGSKDIPIALPSWLSEDDINFYVAKFKQTGFTGGLNYYRAMDLTWELMGPWARAQIKVPVKFIMGDLDLIYNFPNMKDYIHKGGFK